MPLTATGQFYPGVRRGVPFRFPGMPGNNGMQILGGDPASRRQSMLNDYLNSRNMGFSGAQTLMNYNPQGMEALRPGVMAEAESWLNQQQSQLPQGNAGPLMWAAQTQRQPDESGNYRYGGFETPLFKWKGIGVKPGSPFAPDSPGVFDSLFPEGVWPRLPGAPPPPWMGESVQQRSSVPAVPPMFGVGGASALGASRPPSVSAPGSNVLPAYQGIAAGSMLGRGSPMSVVVSNHETAPGIPGTPSIGADYGRIGLQPPALSQPYIYGSYLNPSGTPTTDGGWVSPEFVPNAPAFQYTPEEQAAMSRQRSYGQSSFGDAGLMPESYRRFAPGGAMSVPSQSSGPQPVAPGTTYGGGSMVINLPNGSQAMVGRSIVNEALAAMPPGPMTPEQRHDAVLRYYTQGLAGRDPGNYGDSARAALSIDAGRNVGYQGFTPEQRLQMARNRNIAQGGTGEGTYEEVAADNNRRYVAAQAQRRAAAAEGRRQQLQQGQEIRRESILEGRYGDAARRRFAVESAARQGSQSPAVVADAIRQVPMTTDASGNKTPDSSPAGLETWMANLETTRGDRWADEAIAAIDSGRVPWNRESIIAALQTRERDLTDFTSTIGVALDEQQADALSRSMDRHNKLRARLGLEPWTPRGTMMPWPFSLIAPSGPQIFQ